MVRYGCYPQWVTVCAGMGTVWENLTRGIPAFNPRPNWEMHLCLFNMGHMIYVLDQFFNVKSMVAFHFAIGLTIFGNFSKYALHTVPNWEVRHSSQTASF